MKRKKTDLVIDKNLKKKIVVIGAVFFIISVGVNNILRDFFSQKIIPEEPKKVHVITDPEEEQNIPITNEKVERLLKKAKENILMKYIIGITKYGSHTTATKLKKLISEILGEKYNLPIEKVADYIYKELRSMGLSVRVQDWEQYIKIENLFNPSYHRRFFVGKNIEATLHGTNESSDEIYILVAHYDSWYFSVGANACTSGVAAVLAIAELLSECSFEHTVRFLFVDGEFQGGLGLKEYVKEADEFNENIVAAFFIDSIGNPGFDYFDDDIVISLKKTCWVSDFTSDVNSRYRKFLNFTLNEDCTGNHKHENPFLEFGYDAICFCEADYDNIPTSSDTYEKIDKNIDWTYATNIMKLVIATLCELAMGLNK